jgi:purine nucleoside permease
MPHPGTIHDSLYHALSSGLFAAYELASEDRNCSRNSSANGARYRSEWKDSHSARPQDVPKGWPTGRYAMTAAQLSVQEHGDEIVQVAQAP